MPRRNLPPLYESLRFAVFTLKRPTGAAKEDYLRRRLRRSPRWTDGHLLLAELLFREAANSKIPPDRRSLSALRVSAIAAKTLLGRDPMRPPARSEQRSRREQEAELWTAGYEFLEKRYQESLARLETVLEETNVKQLSGAHHLLALEYAASAAAVLGREEEAKSYLESIPVKDRPKDMHFLKQMLDTRAGGS